MYNINKRQKTKDKRQKTKDKTNDDPYRYRNLFERIGRKYNRHRHFVHEFERNIAIPFAIHSFENVQM